MDQVAQIREKIDIVSLISEHVPLKKAGRNFKSPCPFHNEKSPSFVVSPERQIWHCFGCGKGGDVYTFLMEYERLEFAEALRMLAQRAGITLVNQTQSAGVSSQKERLYQINSLTKEYYHYVLTKHPAGKRAMEYLTNRGVSDKMIQTFMIGFAPTGNALSTYLTQKKKYPKEDLIAAGVAFQGNRGVVDFFRGRVMFPLIDHRDNVVGFAGRILEGDTSTSKYVNTRETLIYHKGEHFFGINVTKDAIRRENQAIIVEGELDVISCFEHGVSNVVAVKGTALTEAQVNLLGRFAQKITFCFDGDNAGQEAIKRSLTIVEKKNITPTVIEIPGGKDPDESLKNEPGQFKKAVKEDIGVYDYLLDKTFEAYDRQTAEGKKKISDTLLPFLAAIKNEIIKEHYLRKLSSSLDTSYESIQREIEKLHTKIESRVEIKSVAKIKRTKEEVLEEYLFALIIQNEKPTHHAHLAVTIMSEVFEQERAYQKLLLQLSSYSDEGHFSAQAFARNLPHELIPSYDTSLLFPMPHFSDEQKVQAEVESVALKLKQIYIQKRLKAISLEIQEKEDAGDEESVIALKTEYSLLTTHIK